MSFELSERDLPPDPIALVQRWYADAQAADLPQPDAMTLATATADGRPSARAVLLKGIDARGFVFYTNYESRKGRELDANPHAALVLLWLPLDRQVRVTGSVARLDPEESDAYFATRPRGSQLGAWASEQSRPLADRAELEERWRALDQRYGGAAVPRPPHWGGYRVEPDEIELWQGRANRLHDRFRYTRAAGGDWRHARLQP
ncbi:MAG TPA: pyridoxamine 5'-phosphate oxidase [Conexibacter sp.]|nr:pyridoxamine 5'-phosphate oxidase [Conexibacter sp.]